MFHLVFLFLGSSTLTDSQTTLAFDDLDSFRQHKEADLWKVPGCGVIRCCPYDSSGYESAGGHLPRRDTR